MRSPLEVGRTALPVVANRAAHFALLVRARAADEQIEPRVRRERLIQSAANLQRDRLAPFGDLQQIMDRIVMRIDRPAVDFQQNVAHLQAGHCGQTFRHDDLNRHGVRIDLAASAQA